MERAVSEKRMPISEHLRELRARVILSLVAVVLGMIIAYVFCPDVVYPMLRAPLDALQGRAADNPFVLHTPLLDALAEQQRGRTPGGDGGSADSVQLHYLSLVDPLIVRLKVSLVAGFILALPVVVYEVWAFVAAGLYAHERRYVLVFGPASLVLFLVGAALAYFVVLPVGVVVLINQGHLFDLKPLLMLKEYAPFVMWLMFGFGVIFQMPLVVVFLTRIGVVGPAGLARSRRYAILLIVIVAACLTPPDVFTQIAMAVPMMGLYELSILLSRLVSRKHDEPTFPAPGARE